MASIERLRKLARIDQVEVEHIIAASFARDPKMLACLQELSVKYDWPMTNLVDGCHMVPLGKWADVAGTFIRDGYDGLVARAVVNGSPTEDTHFCLSFLEDYQTIESVSAVIEIIKTITPPLSVYPEIRRDVIHALNFSLPRNEEFVISDEQAVFLRNFLHHIFTEASTNVEKIDVISALGVVGDASSYELIMCTEGLDDEYLLKRAKRYAIKALRKRLHPTGQ